jgi:aspartate-semialdehyde dehydrogenase
MRIAVVGATGMVGRIMLQVLEERNIPCTELIPVASERSAGSKVRFKGKDYTVIGMKQAVSLRPDVALFSAGGSTSLEWAPKFAEVGTYVIDNSSAWRMDPNIPLVVPEVNPDALTRESRIIANPNCSTIQLVVALWPLHKAFGIERMVVSTYQSVTGTGKKAMDTLNREQAGEKDTDSPYAHTIHRNVIPQCDVFLENGYTKEEMKVVNESRKIMGLPNLKVTATAVRVPVAGGHSEAVNVRFSKAVTAEAVRDILRNAPGVIVQDDPAKSVYPMPLNAEGRDEVFVGRIRKDESEENSMNLWVVSDNLRKGAATNSVQILEMLMEKGILLGTRGVGQGTRVVTG